MKFQSVLKCAVLIACLLSDFSPLFAQEGKISGYMFGDYFYEMSHPDTATDALNRNGFQFRRIYLTYDRDLSPKFSVRFRLEMNSPALGRNDQLVPYIKHAYLNWRNLIAGSNLLFGLCQTPTFAETENVWGYRAIEKTIMDLRQVAGSADMGVALQGKLGDSGVLNYYLMLANGAGVRAETDQNKRVYLSVPLKFQNAYFIIPYVDYEGGDDGRDKNTLALFAGLQKPGFHGGVEAFRKNSNKALANNNDRTESGVSIFGAVKAAKQVKLFGRFDIYDPNTDLDDDGNTLIIAGLDFAADNNVNVMPNLRIENYQQADVEANTIAALTFYYRF